MIHESPNIMISKQKTKKHLHFFKWCDIITHRGASGTCRCGEIGRRNGLKIRRGQLRAGSTPASGTMKKDIHWMSFFSYTCLWQVILLRSFIWLRQVLLCFAQLMDTEVPLLMKEEWNVFFIEFYPISWYTTFRTKRRRCHGNHTKFRTKKYIWGWI